MKIEIFYFILCKIRDDNDPSSTRKNEILSSNLNEVLKHDSFSLQP